MKFKATARVYADKTKWLVTTGLIIFMVMTYGLSCAQGLSIGSASCESSFPLELYVGYASNGGMTTLKDEVLFFAFDFDYDPTHALYLGIGLPIDLGDLGDFHIKGNVTIPSTSRVESIWPPKWRPIIGNPRHEADWEGDTFWGALEGLWSYPVGSMGSFLCGFRWDNWQTSLTNPTDIDVNSARRQTDSGDLTINAYLPLIGVETSYRGFRFGAFGFPTAFGDIEVKSSVLSGERRFIEEGSYDSGYFLEIFTEYKQTIAIAPNVGPEIFTAIFAKFSTLRASGNIPWTITDDTGNPAPINPAQDPPEITPFSFQRNLFVIGGKAEIRFSMPELGNLL